MFAHLMVPVDDSMLSAGNVEAAVQLAHKLDARITFFHATADLTTREDGDVLRMIAPQEFEEAAKGDTHAVLARAATTAKVLGVPCQSLSRVCDRPAEAIVEAAQQHGCDLIVMASRGARHGLTGWLHSSQTERVLRQSPIALLVTRVAANKPLTASERALAVILEEHRSIAAVVSGMRDLVGVTDEAVDLTTLEAMVAYLQAFPLKLHHPKEEDFLHRLLRLRCPDSAALLAQIEAQHAQEHERVLAVLEAMRGFRGGNDAAARTLRERVVLLADGVWQHLGLEEREVLPLAQQHLQADDWAEMARAFEGNDDPGFGELPAREFRRLFTRIANLLPIAGPQA